MSGKKIIAVVGATGQQGGGVARAILDDPDGGFAVRALTRNPEFVRTINPRLQDFATWLAAHREQFTA